MILTAICASCGKKLKSVHLALPAEIVISATHVVPTLNNCLSCGARGARIADESVEAERDGRG